MDINDFGFEKIKNQFNPALILPGFEIGRVVSEQKERYCVVTNQGEFDAEVTGNLRYSAQGRDDFPAVGDWVNVSLYENGFAIIQSILPRYSLLKRSSVGAFGESQIIAANIDYSLLLLAVDRDFNINRVERYLTICNEAHIQSILVLSKIDLLADSELAELRGSIKDRVKNVPIVLLSNENLSGYDELKTLLFKGSTYCMIGSSGVGKSTLLNNLAGTEVMKTGAISAITNKGKHTTSFREIVVLPGGAIIIDNPGMREVGIGDSSKGLEITYDKIVELAKGCKFKNCTHTNEPGCAVIAALQNGEIDSAVYQNFLKLENENRYFRTTVVEKHKKDRAFGKMLKNYTNDKRQGKF